MHFSNVVPIAIMAICTAKPIYGLPPQPPHPGYCQPPPHPLYGGGQFPPQDPSANPLHRQAGQPGEPLVAVPRKIWRNTKSGEAKQQKLTPEREADDPASSKCACHPRECLLALLETFEEEKRSPELLMCLRRWKQIGRACLDKIQGPMCGKRGQDFCSYRPRNHEKNLEIEGRKTSLSRCFVPVSKILEGRSTERLKTRIKREDGER